MSKIIEVKNVEQFNMVIDSAKAVLVDFSASWCGPCKVLSKDLHKWVDEENKYPNVTIIKIDVDNEELSSLCADITGIPNVKFYKLGKRVDYTYTNQTGKTITYSELSGYSNKTLVEEVLKWLDT
jgi:thioredoxin 1